MLKFFYCYHFIVLVSIALTLLPCSFASSKSSTKSRNSLKNYFYRAVNNVEPRSSWSVGRCSVTCGQGIKRRRVRSCQPGQQCFGADVVTEICRLEPCPDVGADEPVWSPWSACSGSCGMGTRKRTRTCKSQAAPCFDSQIESCREDTVIPPCPVNGAWSDWYTFLPCPTRNLEKVCQFPTKYQQVQMRFCSSPYPAYGGKDCEGPEFNYTSCAKIIPLCGKAHWSSWQPFGMCSVTCGTGVAKKSRICIGMTGPTNKCFGPSLQSEECKMPPCPRINGAWSNWREIQSCTVSKQNSGDPCKDLPENEIKILERKCDNPAPSGGGLTCQGESRRTEKCRSFFKCPLSALANLLTTTTLPFFLPTSWSAWELTGSCGVTCGNGLQRRVRICVPELGPGSEKQCPGPAEEMVPCKMADCPSIMVIPSIVIPSGEGLMTVTLADTSSGEDDFGDLEDDPFTEWSAWSHCDTKCKQTRRRACKQKRGAVDCESGATFETRNCPRMGKEVCWVDGALSFSPSKNFPIGTQLLLLLATLTFLLSNLSC